MFKFLKEVKYNAIKKLLPQSPMFNPDCSFNFDLKFSTSFISIQFEYFKRFDFANVPTVS